MAKIWAFIKRDLRHLKYNVISLVVLVGIICVPTFYAWFNIAGSWDPYGNTSNLKVAVANSDKGYTSELMPVELNFGERVVSDLRESTSIGYVVTSEEDALEGVRSGEYYAAVVIPEDFSTDLLTALSSNPVKAQVKFYQNEKANAIAEIVTNKASSAIEKDIDEAFAESITTVGAGVLDQLGTYLDDDKVSEVADKLDEAISNSSDALTSTASQMRGFSSTLSATAGLLGSGNSTFATSLSATLNVGTTLTSAASNVRDLGNALDGATSSVNDALASSSASLDSVSAAIDNAFEVADGPTDKLIETLGNAQSTASANQQRLNALADKLSSAISVFESAMSKLEEGTKAYNAMQDLRDATTELRDNVKAQASAMGTLADKLGSTKSELEQGKSDTATARQELKDVVAAAKQGISQVQGDYESTLKGSLSTLANQIDSAAGDADSITSSLNATLDSVNSTAGSAGDALNGACSSLDEAADVLEKAATKMSDLHTRLRDALDSEDVNQVRTILSGDVTSLASFISSPVAVDRNALYAIENNGSAMAPFYTTLAIWIGGVVLAALVKANASEKALEETGCSHTQAYIGRLALFAGVGFLQSALICAGDLYFLGVQCANPVLFFLAGWVASFVFINIIYALTASFGDVGKAVAVVLMVIQVAGSGGTFPKEMLPEAFQALYPFLPFVHSENAMRAAMFGLYGNDYWVCLPKLLAFLIPALLLGLFLRRPIIRANEWFEEKLESTKVM